MPDGAVARGTVDGSGFAAGGTVEFGTATVAKVIRVSASVLRVSAGVAPAVAGTDPSGVIGMDCPAAGECVEATDQTLITESP